MMKVSQETHDKMFDMGAKSVIQFVDSAEHPHEGMMSDELCLGESLCIPFPHEHEVSLAAEKQHIFGNDILIDLAPGSGEKAKHYLSPGLACVLIFQTATHKKVVLDHLNDYVKMMNLVSLEGSPPKPTALINFEKASQLKVEGLPRASVSSAGLASGLNAPTIVSAVSAAAASSDQIASPPPRAASSVGSSPPSGLSRLERAEAHVMVAERAAAHAMVAPTAPTARSFGSSML
jgi:hypothetical protein